MSNPGWCSQCAQSPRDVLRILKNDWEIDFTICQECLRKLQQRAEIALEFEPIVKPRRGKNEDDY